MSVIARIVFIDHEGDPRSVEAANWRREGRSVAASRYVNADTIELVAFHPADVVRVEVLDTEHPEYRQYGTKRWKAATLADVVGAL